MCFLGRWQEELHNILLPLVNSVWPFQHPFPIVPASSAGQERVVSQVLSLTHPRSRPHHPWFSFPALGPPLLLSWLKRCSWSLLLQMKSAGKPTEWTTHPVEDVSVRATGILSQQRQSPLHPLLEKQRGPGALSPKPPSDLSCTFTCNPLTVYRNPRQLHCSEV